MDIFIERDNKSIKKTFSGLASVLLKDLEINSEEILLIRNDKLVTDDEELKDSDSIKLLAVVSGG